MNKLLLFLLIILQLPIIADNFKVLGKVKVNDNAFTGKSIPIKLDKASFKKSKDLEFSFKYLDRGQGFFMVEFATSDELYSMLDSDQIKTADGVKLTDSGKWKEYKVILRGFNPENICKFDLNIAARQANLTVSNIKVKPFHTEAKTYKKSDKMNVLMIIVDDLNDYVRSFGDPQAITPNVDRLVSESMKFTRAYCQYPVCGPSRASFLSGLYPESSKILNNKDYFREVNPKATNLFEHFKRNGYWTGGTGKIFHSKFGLFEKGSSFDEYEKFHNAANPQTQLLKKRFDESGAKGSFKDFEKAHRVNDQGEQVLFYGTELKDEQHGDGRSARKVAQWFKEKPFSEKPFLIACGLVKPHVPFYAPQKYFDLFPKSKLQFENVPENDWETKPGIAAVKSYKRFRSELGVNNRKVRSEYLQAYLACISFMDAQVKVLMDSLKENGLDKNTVIVFMSDHGFHIGEHFMYGKVTLFEECTRVPFSIRLPGSSNNGKSTDSFAELVDVYPTLVDICKLPQPEHKLQGKSLLPILKNPKVSVKNEAYTVVSRGDILGRSVRDSKWRFADWGSDKNLELYNLENDPRQYNNLANKRECSEVLKRMKKILASKKLQQP